MGPRGRQLWAQHAAPARMGASSHWTRDLGLHFMRRTRRVLGVPSVTVTASEGCSLRSAGRHRALSRAALDLASVPAV